MIVPALPGGIADLGMRRIANKVQDELQQPVVVQNRPGGAGGGAVAAVAVKQSAADGYTLLSATPQVAIVQSMVKELSFDPRRDLAPVSLVGTVPNVLLVNPDRSQKSLAELLAFARANPGKLNYSSTGAGTSVHLSAELFKYVAAINKTNYDFIRDDSKK